MRQSVLAVNFAQGPTITLASGTEFDLLNPHASCFTIEDIAQGLSNICRYSGQCCAFYSVAEHSLLVSAIAKDYPYEGLLHDAAEAFIGDITRPLKQLLPEYKLIETNIEDAIAERFGLNKDHLKAVKAADLRVLAAEQEQVMRPGSNGWWKAAAVIPAPVTVRFLSPREARREFLERFEFLRSLR